MPPGYKCAMTRSPAAEPANSRAGAPAAGLDIELVVAVADDDAIGRGNGLPWHLPSDLRRFKALTLGKTVLMGRRTHESIGRALPGRTNVVLTRSPEFAAPNCLVAGSLDEARRAAPDGQALMVIGGAEIYRLCLPLAGRIHLTQVHATVPDADAFFSGWRGGEWREAFCERHAADEKNPFAYSFITLERDRPASG